MRLFRPVGIKELNLIKESGMIKFPSRLAEQPIFYPVLNIEYARQIALEWNTKVLRDMPVLLLNLMLKMNIYRGLK